MNLKPLLALNDWNTRFAHIWFNPAIPVIVLEDGVFVEEPAIPPTHVVIADHPPFSNSNRAQILQTVHEPILVNPI